jgi:hypothetical protein
VSKNKRKVKPVNFSLINERDLKRLEFAEKINPLTGKPRDFTKYVKELIDDDMRGINRHGGAPGASPIVIERITEDESDPYTMEAMSGFL